MASRDSVVDAGDEDATVMVPYNRESTPSAETAEAWEETTQIDQPWEAETPAMHAAGLALPAPFDADCDDELTDYALVIESPTPPVLEESMPTPPVLEESMPTPPMMPTSALPPPLRVRTNLGTTPPPRAPTHRRTSITWKHPAQEGPRPQAATRELTRMPFPEPIPHTRPNRALVSDRRKRRIAIAATVLALGTLAAILLAGAGQEAAPHETRTVVVSVPILIPVGVSDKHARTARDAPTHSLLLAAQEELGEGVKLLEANELVAAEHSLRRALGMHASLDEAVRLLAIVYQRRGNRGRALRWYQRYLARVPKGAKSDAIREAIERMDGGRRHTN